MAHSLAGVPGGNHYRWCIRHARGPFASGALGPALDQTYLSGTPRAQRPAAARQTGIFDIKRHIRHKRAYSTQTGVVDTGPVTPAMTSHRTRADEWSIPHTGRVPMLPGSVLDRLDPGRVVCCHRLSVAWLVLTAGVCAHDGIKFVQRNCG